MSNEYPCNFLDPIFFCFCMPDIALASCLSLKPNVIVLYCFVTSPSLIVNSLNVCKEEI